MAKDDFLKNLNYPHASVLPTFEYPHGFLNQYLNLRCLSSKKIGEPNEWKSFDFYLACLKRLTEDDNICSELVNDFVKDCYTDSELILRMYDTVGQFLSKNEKYKKLRVLLKIRYGNYLT